MESYFDDKLIDNTLQFIVDNLKDKGKIFVGFSGGKDSIVTADLMKKSGLDHQLYYSVTGIDPPEVVKFIRRNYPDCKFLRPKYTFWHSLLTKNPPSKTSRWCCTSLKKEPSYKLDVRHKVFGIRAEESTKRAKYKLIENHIKLNHLHYYPILHWNEGEIWDYIEVNELPYPELYDWGLSRIGCVICPFNTDKMGQRCASDKKRWPRYYKLFEKKCGEWYRKRQKQGKEMFFDTPEEFISEWYKGNVRWYKHEEPKTDQMNFGDFNETVF